MEYKVTEKDLKGLIDGFPIEVVQKMIERQVEQGNKADVILFQTHRTYGKSEGGFKWDETEEGNNFWCKVIIGRNFDLFFEKYPKPNKIKIEKDMETKKIILNGITLPKGTEAKVSVEDGATIITFQKQEEVKNPKFKKGDFIHSTTKDGDYWISIFDRIENGMVYTYADFGLEDGNIHGFEEKLRFSDIKKLAYIRLCTEPEKCTMCKELANQKHLRWNAEEFKFEELRWRAVNEQKYYYVNEYGVRCSDGDYGFELDNKRYALHNYFQTKELANKAWTLYRDFFKNLKLD